MNALNDTKTSELSKSAEGNGEYLWSSVRVVVICQGVDKKQISKWHNWPKKPRKCCTKMKPELNLLGRFDLFTRRHDHHQTVEQDGGDDYDWEERVDLDVDGHTTHGAERRQEPHRVGRWEPKDVFSLKQTKKFDWAFFDAWLVVGRFSGNFL